MQTEMQTFHSVELFCSAMLTQLDLSFPEGGEGSELPNYLRVAAALDMLDVIIPVLGSFQPVITRLRDEFVRAIYMPDKRKGKSGAGGGWVEAGNESRGASKKSEAMRLNTLKPLWAQKSHLWSVKGGADAVREGSSYFSRTPYFKSGIRTYSDNEWVREMDTMLKGLETQVKNLRQNGRDLETEKENLEKRIEGFQMRTQVLYCYQV